MMILKIAVLLLCAVVSVIISCYSEHKKGTCLLLSFFVAAGVTTFFTEDAIATSLVTALGVFLILAVLTTLLSQKTMHRKNGEGKHKTV